MTHRATLLLLYICLVNGEFNGQNSDVCLNHHTCYDDLLLNRSHFNIIISKHEERSAVTCANSCLRYYPQTQVVMTKLVDINQLLSCGCGSELALANPLGVVHDYYNCYICPDSDNQKCGSDKYTSIYFIQHTHEPCPRLQLELPETVSPTTTTTTSTTITTDAPEKYANITNTTNIDMYSSNSHLFIFLGCYMESQVNESVVVTEYLEGESVGVEDCYNSCSTIHPTAELLLVKLLNSGKLYCGCGQFSSLAFSPVPDDGMCDLTCQTKGKVKEMEQCGGWYSVSVYTRSNGSRTTYVSFVVINVLLVLLLSY